MFNTCDSACQTGPILTKLALCEQTERSKCPAKLLLADCSFSFPTGTPAAIATALDAAVTAGLLTATPLLGQVAWGEPTTTTKKTIDCKPAKVITTGRELTARDYAAINVNPTTQASQPYFDYDFYKNQVSNGKIAVRGYTTCDGEIRLFLDENGNFMSNTLNVYLADDTDVENQCIEYKNISLTFVGDPRKFNAPYLDIQGAGANATLGWLYK